ncbi:hypothetical protein D3C71_1720730 [compost metagenome]
MAVSLIEAGQYGLALKIDYFSLRSCQLQQLLRAADCGNAFSLHRYCFCGCSFLIEGKHRAVNIDLFRICHRGTAFLLLIIC